MAQEPNEVGGGAAGETSEIREEIARTRSEMSETIEEIQERLKPEHLIQQAKDSVQEAAAGKMRTMMHTAEEAAQTMAGTTQRTANRATSFVREHPVQVALMATAVTWLMTRNHGSDWETDSYNSYDTYDTYGSYEGTESYQAAGSFEGGADSYGDRQRVGETAAAYAARMKGKAREVTDQVRNAASNATRQVNRGWQQSRSSLDTWMAENPLAVGAVALALGAAIGMSVPRTRLEDQTFGETRDTVLEQAGDAARGVRDTVTEKVQAVASDVMGDSKGGDNRGGSPDESANPNRV